MLDFILSNITVGNGCVNMYDKLDTLLEDKLGKYLLIDKIEKRVAQDGNKANDD
jgi:hypothetical protein